MLGYDGASRGRASGISRRRTARCPRSSRCASSCWGRLSTRPSMASPSQSIPHNCAASGTCAPIPTPRCLSTTTSRTGAGSGTYSFEGGRASSTPAPSNDGRSSR